MQMRIATAVATIAMLCVTPAHAQVSVADADAASKSDSASLAAAVNGGNTFESTNIFEGSRLPENHAPMGSLSVFTPSPSGPCEGTAGFGVGAQRFNAGVSWSRERANCDRREDTRLLLAIAAAQAQVATREDAASTVGLAYEVMRGSPHIQEALSRQHQPTGPER